MGDGAVILDDEEIVFTKRDDVLEPPPKGAAQSKFLPLIEAMADDPGVWFTLERPTSAKARSIVGHSFRLYHVNVETAQRGDLLWVRFPPSR